MKRDILRKSAVMIMGVLIGTLSGCKEGSQFFSASGIDKEKKKTEESEETEVIDEPVMTGGSFLVCNRDKSLTAEAATVGVGCRMEDTAGRKLELKDPLKWEIAYVQGAAEIELDIWIEDVTAQQNLPWHWHLQVPEDKISDSQIRVVFNKKEYPEPKAYYAKVEDAIVLPTLFDLMMKDAAGNSRGNGLEDTPKGVWFGDNQWWNRKEKNPGCIYDDAVNDLIGAFKGPNGGQYSFRSQKTTTVKIVLGKICGIEAESAGLLEVGIYKGAQLVAKKVLENDTEIKFENIGVIPGSDYYLKFPAFWDNYVVRVIQMEGAHLEVTGVPPTYNP